jgi:exodeoxyribonuclease VII large subunit
MDTPIKLSVFMARMTRVIALNFPQPLWVQGEISNYKESRGHIYLQLVEKNQDTDQIMAQASAVMWKGQRAMLEKKHGSDLDSLLQDGNEVLVRVNVEFHAVYGFKLQIQDIDLSFSLGQMALKRLLIIQELRDKGLLDRNKQLPIPSVCQRIAVISSGTAAGYQDFQEQLKNNAYGYAFRTQLFSAAMQGPAVENEVVAALKAIGKQAAQFDVVVIIRGGGSKLDLAWFDNAKIGETIAKLSLPVLTGIGHDIDETVTDLVASVALKTPTAVAGWLIDRSMEFESLLIHYVDFIRNTANQLCHTENNQLDRIQMTLSHLVSRIGDRENHRLDIELEKFKNLLRHRLQNFNHNLEKLENQVRQLDPAVVLDRGYSITLLNGMPIKSAASIKEGTQIKTRLSSGSLLSITQKQ